MGIPFPFLFWSGAFELAPTQYPGQGVFFDGLIGIVVIVIYFFSVLLHEGGHKLTASLFGQFYDGHQLTIWGGVPREAESYLPVTSSEMVHRMGGPLANLLAGIVFHFGYSHLSNHPEGVFGGFAPFLFFGMQANFFLALVNLIPFIPMDMGALILRERIRKRPDVTLAWPFQAGLFLSWAIILFGLILASRGLLLSGFGLLFWGVHLARATLLWKGRMGLVHYLLQTDLREYVDQTNTPLLSNQSIDQAFRKGLFSRPERRLCRSVKKMGLTWASLNGESSKKFLSFSGRTALSGLSIWISTRGEDWIWGRKGGNKFTMRSEKTSAHCTSSTIASFWEYFTRKNSWSASG